MGKTSIKGKETKSFGNHYKTGKYLFLKNSKL